MRIDEIGVLQAFSAIEADWSEIRCPNGCYDPYEATPVNIRAAAELPHCDNCDSFHIVEWGSDHSVESDTDQE